MRTARDRFAARRRKLSSSVVGGCARLPAALVLCLAAAVSAVSCSVCSGCRPRTTAGPIVETPRAPAPAFSLYDQENRPVSREDIRGKAAAIIAANDSHGREMPAWEEPLSARFGERIAIVRLMDLSGLPRLARSFAQARIKQEMKGDSLALDWDGKVFKDFGFDPNRVNVAIVDRNGIVLVRVAGVPDEAARRRVFAAVESALAAGR